MIMKSESQFSPRVSGEQHDIRVREHEMSDEEIRTVASEFGLEVDKTRELLLKGLNLLASEFVASPFIETIPGKLSTEPIQKPFRLSTGKRGVREFRLFFDRQRFLETVGSLFEDGREYFDIAFKRRDIDFDVSMNRWVDTNILEDIPSIIMVDIDNSDVPLVKNQFNYGMYTGHDDLCAILPFESSLVDMEATDQVAAPCFDEGVFFRKLPMGGQKREEEVKILLHDVARIVKVISATDERLGILPDKGKKLSLILNTEGFDAAATRRRDRKEELHRTLKFSRNDIEGVSGSYTPENSASRIRHEYLHAVDNMLSRGGRYFSEEIAEDLVRVVAKYLFPGQDIFLKNDGETVVWPDRSNRNNRVEEAVAEHLFLVDPDSDKSGLPGHPSDNIRELFVSIMNCYLDPRFDAALVRAEAKRIKLASLYREIEQMVTERINEINKVEVKSSL